MTIKSAIRKLAPRGVHAYRILQGPLRGRIIVTSLHDYPGAVLGRTEADLVRWIRTTACQGETWLDVGAHYGYTTIALAEAVGSRGRIFAFEPSIRTAGYLKQTCSLNMLDQVTVVPLALGSEVGIRMRSVPIDRGMANHRLGGATTDTIYVIGFDDFWPMMGTPNVDGVKIDVQGMEFDVLGGMLKTLSRCHPKLVIEFHAGVNRRALLELLTASDYQLPGLPIEQVAGFDTAIYADDHSYAFSSSRRPR